MSDVVARLQRVTVRPARAIEADRAALDPCEGGTGAADRGVAEWLCLAVAPVCALMALYVGVHDDSTGGGMAAAMHRTAPLGGMAPMYALMSLFHLAPWVRRLSARRPAARTGRGG